MERREDNWSEPLENPLTGERFRFWRGPLEEGAGEGTVRVELTVRGGSAGIPPHIHPYSDEYFRVIKGVLGAKVGKETFELYAGQERNLPKGVVHSWWNASDEDLLMVNDVSPGMNIEPMLRAMAGWAQKAHDEGKGEGAKPPFLMLCVLLRKYPDDIAMPGLPHWVQKILCRSFGLLGQMRGYGWILEAQS